MRRKSRRYNNYGWAPYVPVAKRRQIAEREAAARRKKGEVFSPVIVSGRSLAATFWGQAWCRNLERYGDYANRLPRGRTYVRSGAVIDLQVEAGRVRAQVMGSSLYQVEVDIVPLAPDRWQALVAECTGKIGSALELLQGKLSKEVMEIITRGGGLFPEPKEIRFRCSCPDWAAMCKHVAATLYGVGARLDQAPELLFLLRKVDPAEMVGRAGVDAILQGTAPTAANKLEESDLAGLFGIELDELPVPAARASSPRSPAEKRPAPPGPVVKRTVEKPPKETRGTPAAPSTQDLGVPRRAASPAPPSRRKASETAEPAVAPKKRGRSLPPPPAPRLITAKELTAQGIPHPLIQQWLNKGILHRTGQRGVYEATARLAPALQQAR